MADSVRGFSPDHSANGSLPATLSAGHGSPAGPTRWRGSPRTIVGPRPRAPAYGTLELKQSRKILQEPSACFLKIVSYFPSPRTFGPPALGCTVNL